MPNLDDAVSYEKLDPAGMRARIAELPQQCAAAWRLAQELCLPAAYRRARQVVVAGMGGSAIGGALLNGLVADDCPAPLLSVRGYDLPAHVGADSLVVASSYSGNTEETLSVFDQAVDRGCMVLAMTTGGKLAERAEKLDLPVLRFAYRSAPRAALGYSFILLLGLLSHLGLLRDYSAAVDEAIAVLETWQQELAPKMPTKRNPAKQLALRLVDRLPVVYGAGFLGPVAQRWKGQFNENSKCWAFWEELPEIHHNAVLGYGMPDDVREEITVLMLRSPLDHPRVQARWEATEELLRQARVAQDTVWGRGESALAQMLSLIHCGDYTSLYLAVLNGVDPTAMAPIEQLKRRLAQM